MTCSDTRDRLLYTLGRLLDSFVDVVAAVTFSSEEGIDASLRDELTGLLSRLDNLTGTDLFVSYMVRCNFHRRHCEVCNRLAVQRVCAGWLVKCLLAWQYFLPLPWLR